MKTIAPAAMAAIEAGDAIVTGAVEITPRVGISGFETVGDVDVASNVAGVPVTLSGFDPADLIVVTKPAGLTYQAWSRWASDDDPLADGLPWHNDFWVTNAEATLSHYWFGSLEADGDPTERFVSAAAAEAAFAGDSVTLTGSTAYTFDIQHHAPIDDDRGGLSLHVERGIAVAGAGAPIRLWGGDGYKSFATDSGVQQFTGIGDRGLVQVTNNAIGGVAQGLTLTLSGIEPAALALLDGNELKGASVVVCRLIFANDGKTLLDAHVFDRGRVDTVSTKKTKGGPASINLAVESAARGLGRSGSRMRSDADQRLINAIDGYFRNVAYAGQKTTYWGGKIPTHNGGDATRGM